MFSLILINLLLIVFISTYLNPQNDLIFKASCKVLSTTSYVPHSPIQITSNDDFALLGFPGNGTAADPYQISGLNITSSSTNLIEIQNTNCYFVITNNLLNGLASNYNAISFQSVSNGRIEGNIIHSCYNGMS
ncbi:MAG: hypothetical protein ACTSPG_09545, partial [Candidatus Hodarchaeales archaeon]